MDPTTDSPHGNLLPGYPVMSYRSTDAKGKTTNSATPTANSDQYKQEVYEDGTTVVSKWSPDKNAWEPQSETVNSAIAARNNRENKPTAAGKQRSESQAELDDARAKEAAARTASISANSGVPAENADTAQARAGTAQQNADTAAGRLNVQDYTAQKTAAYQEAQLRLNQIKADQAQQKIGDSEANNQRLAVQNNFSNQLRVIDQQQAAARQASLDSYRASTERRLSDQSQAKQGLSETEFAYNAGQDAVKNALEQQKFSMGNPTFASEYATGLGVLSGGGGAVHFSPQSLMAPQVDYNAIADAAAKRAVAMLHGGIHPADALASAPAAAPSAAAAPTAGPAAAPGAAPAPAAPSPIAAAIPPYQPPASMAPAPIPFGASAA